MAAEQRLLWPDLRRFGASLTVALNPSVGRTFLKLTILDRELFTRTSAQKSVNLNTCLREAGFAFCANETAVNTERAYKEARQSGRSEEQAKRAAAQAREALFFYSNSTVIKQARIRLIVPAIESGDYCQMPIDDIRHLDFSFLSIKDTTAFILSQQRLRDARPGVFYTTPADRELANAFEHSTFNIHEILEYRDLPPVGVNRGPDFSGTLAQTLAFHPVQIIERAVRQQTLGLDGIPLRAPALSTAVPGYATFSAAVAANDGSEIGVETIRLSFGIPIAFEARGSRLLILKDARFLEFNATQVPDVEELHSVQRHIDFMGHVLDVRDAYEEIKPSGLFEAHGWVDRTVTETIRRRCEFIFNSMKEALAPFAPSRGFLEPTDIAQFGSQREARFSEHHPRDFLRFLHIFRTQLYNAVQQRSMQLEAQVIYEAGLGRLLKSISGVDGSGTAMPGADTDDGSFNQRRRATKEDVWPPIDFALLQERGVSPEIAFVISEFRRNLPIDALASDQDALTSDGRSTPHVSTPALREQYVRAVKQVRDALMGVSTLQELAVACDALSELAGISSSAPVSAASGDRALRWNAENWFQDALGPRFVCDFLPRSCLDSSSGASSSAELEQLLEVASATTAGGWHWTLREPVEQPPVGMLGGTRRSDLSSGLAELRQHDPFARSSSAIERIGPDRRAGIDIDEKMMIDVFKLRALEFGIWIPQNERQTVLNHAFDAFMDLAEVMGLPPEALGLGGQLSVAIGARGTGATGAQVAHYQVGEHVLNLPQLSGAGSVARAWAHAFDSWLGEVSQVSARQGALEAAAASPKSNGLPQIVRDLSNAVRDSKTVAMTLEEAARAWSFCQVDGQTVSISQRLSSRLQEWIRSLDALLPDAIQQGSFRAYAATRLEQQWVPIAGLEVYEMWRLQDVDSFVGDLVDRMDREFGSQVWRVRANLTLPTQLASIHASAEASIRRIVQEYSPELNRKNSQLFADALWLDEPRKSPFWATDSQIFQRIFEAWVQDRITASTGRRSDYLVYGCQVERDSARSAYPKGAERAAINASLDCFFDRNRVELQRMRCATAPVQSVTTKARGIFVSSDHSINDL